MAPHVAMVTGRRLATNSCSHALVFFPFFSFFSVLVSSPLVSSSHLYPFSSPPLHSSSRLPPLCILHPSPLHPSVGRVKAGLKWQSRKAPDRLTAGPGEEWTHSSRGHTHVRACAPKPSRACLLTSDTSTGVGCRFMCLVHTCVWKYVSA